MLEQEIRELNSLLKQLIPAIQQFKQLELPLDNPNETDTLKTEQVKESAPTVTDIQNALVEYGNKLGKPAARALLNAYKAKKIGDLSEDQYPGFLSDISAALEQAA